MSGKSVTVSLRMEPELVERISAATDNRNRFIIEAVKEKLNPVRLDDALTDREKTAAIKGAKNISDLMQDLILQEAARRKNFLNRIDDETFAKLVASRLPKESSGDDDMEKNVLSLRSCLDRMPAVADLTAELAKLKGQLYKAEKERDLNLTLLRHADGKAELAELMKLCFNSAVAYAVDLVARNNLPGFGDGGGISELAYSETAEIVRKALEEMKVYRSKAK